MKDEKLSKLFRALELMAGPRGASIHDLENNLSCGRKTVYRVLKSIEAMGVPVEESYDLEGRTNSKRRRLKPVYADRLAGIIVRLDARERFLFRYLLEKDDLLSDSALRPVIDELRNKLDRLILCDTREGPPSVFTNYKHRKDYRGMEGIIDRAIGALRKRLACQVTYAALSTGLEKTYDIHPYTLLEHSGGLYLICGIPAHDDDIRILAVERIVDLKLSTDHFARPIDYDPEEYLKPAFGLVLEESIKVKVWFSADVAESVRVRRWGQEQKIEDKEDESLIMSFVASGREEIKAWVRSFGPEAELLEPAYLRQEIKVELSEAARRY